MDCNTRIIDLTVGELQQLIEGTVRRSVECVKAERASMPEYVYGIQGLADVLGCSKSYACRLKNSGRYKKAIKQDGRRIVVNKTLLLNMM